MSFQARHNGQNYVFALLTGYRDPPAGVSVCLSTFACFFFFLDASFLCWLWNATFFCDGYMFLRFIHILIAFQCSLGLSFAMVCAVDFYDGHYLVIAIITVQALFLSSLLLCKIVHIH